MDIFSDPVLLARLQFACTAAYHFIFVPLTIGLGLILAINETRYYRSRDPKDAAATKFWVKIFTATFVLGLATGITMEFSFGTNWADYSRFVGDIFGAPLAAEALLAFFLESTFLGVLLFGRKRVSPKFYMVSAPAHRAYETKLIKIEDAAKKPLGAMETSNKRVINQFIHPDVLPTCQLSMGMTVLEPGSVWNTMPAHTHERRMEVYMYFEVPEDNVVFHMMGEGSETRHIVMQNEQAVISPSWSIHAGAGTSNYTFIWAMGGENQAFDDMDVIPTTELR